MTEYQKMIERHSAYPDKIKIGECEIIKYIPTKCTYDQSGLAVYYTVQYDNNINRQQYYGKFEQAFNCVVCHPTWKVTITSTPRMSHKTVLDCQKTMHTYKNRKIGIQTRGQKLNICSM